jgi:hypothetical protein
MNNGAVIIALVGAATGIGGAFITANATSAQRTSELDAKVQVLEERQALQYTEVKGELQTIKQDVKEILKAVR